MNSSQVEDIETVQRIEVLESSVAHNQLGVAGLATTTFALCYVFVILVDDAQYLLCGLVLMGIALALYVALGRLTIIGDKSHEIRNLREELRH